MIPAKEIKIIPKKQYKQIINLFENIYEDFVVDQDINRKKYYLQAFNIIKKEVLNLFHNKLFWVLYSLSDKSCEHIYGINSKRCGDICGRTIELKFDGNNYKCSRHIGIKHNPIPNNIPKEEKCKGFTKYNKPCSRRGIYWNYCKYHCNKELQEKINIFEKDDFYQYIKDIIKKGVNIKYIYNFIENKREKKNEIEKEINNLLNISYDINLPIYNISKDTEMDIKINNCICIEQDSNYNFICKNIAVENEYLCLNHIEDQLSVFSNESIIDNKFTDNLDETINFIDEYINEHKKEKQEIINKINDTNYLYLENKSDNILKFNNCYNHISEYIKKINRENNEYKNQEIKDNYILSSLGFESLEQLDNFIYNFYDFCYKNNFNNEEELYDFVNKYKNHKCIYDTLLLVKNKINIIGNNTFININYLEDKLKIHNNKFIALKNEIKEDFPKYYNILKGYFEILEMDYKNDINRYIEMAKIKSFIL